MFYVGAIVSFIVALGLWYVVSALILKNEFDIVEISVTVITVLIAVIIAGILTQKGLKKEGIKVTIPKT